MADPLPSFVELMETLGIENDSCAKNGTNVFDWTPSPVLASTNHDISTKAHDIDLSRRGSASSLRTARYTPYAPATKRGSVPNTSHQLLHDEEHLRPHSSPRTHQSFARKPSSYGMASTPFQPELRAAPPKLDTSSCTPISVFARRHSPLGSPTLSSPSQVARRATAESPSEVTLPTLPTVIMPIFARYASTDDLSEPDEPDIAAWHLYPKGFRKQSHHGGTRISSPFRSCSQQCISQAEKRPQLTFSH